MFPFLDFLLIIIVTCWSQWCWLYFCLNYRGRVKWCTKHILFLGNRQSEAVESGVKKKKERELTSTMLRLSFSDFSITLLRWHRCFWMLASDMTQLYLVQPTASFGISCFYRRETRRLVNWRFSASTCWVFSHWTTKHAASAELKGFIIARWPVWQTLCFVVSM